MRITDPDTGEVIEEHDDDTVEGLIARSLQSLLNKGLIQWRRHDDAAEFTAVTRN
jgi:hypothetical protein